MRLFFIKLLMRLLNEYAIIYERINIEKMNEWLMGLHSETNGFKEYFKYRDLQILKTMGNGLTQEQYWMNCGRRSELLHIIGLGADLLAKEKGTEKIEGSD